MTKKQMVEAIQVAEAKAWKSLREAQSLWGIDDAITSRSRAKWSGLYEMREALGLPGLTVSELVEQDLLTA